jgi:hypothetical protein
MDTIVFKIELPYIPTAQVEKKNNKEILAQQVSDL